MANQHSLKMEETSQTKPNVSKIHAIISFFFVIGAWIFSYTILSPFFLTLKFSRRCRNKYFSWIYSRGVSILFPYFPSTRKKVFEQLPTDLTKNIKVLEVGVGNGSNFEYYSSNCELTLLDMNETFEAEIQAKLKKRPDLKVEKIIFGNAEDMKEIADHSYDIIVSTFLLCSVNDVTATLREISRVLKPDGKYLYAEHTGFPADPFLRRIQTFFNPLWNVYANGCNINRLPQDIISQAFSHHSYQIFYPTPSLLFLRPQAVGEASQPRMSYFESRPCIEII